MYVDYRVGQIVAPTDPLSLALLPLSIVSGGQINNGIRSLRLLTAANKFIKFGGDEAILHFGKHSSSIMNALGKTSYNLKNYLDDANYIIKTGTYVPSMNGFVRFAGSNGGKAKYFFVGLHNSNPFMTTFHVKSVKELAKKAPSMFKY